MQKLKLTIFLCFSIVLNLSAQIIVEVKQDKMNYPALGKEERVFYVKKDSILQDTSQIKSFEELLLIGKCNNWDEASCGIINLALFAEKAAKTRGYNAASVNFYRGTSKKDTLSVIFYRLSDAKITALQEENRTQYLTLINPKNGSDIDVKVEGESATLYSGTYLLKEAKKYDISVKLGNGLLKSSANLSFRKLNKRYFIVNGYKLTGAVSGGIGIGVNSPTLMEVGSWRVRY
jgi:hypothetical protein